MTATPCGGPVSEALEADVRRWVGRHGVVIWLDPDSHFSAFVDRLCALRDRGTAQGTVAGGLPYEVKAFRGSHLNLMLALDGLASGTEKTRLLVHMPGFNEESIRRTPLCELYLAGTRYQKSLETLVSEAAGGQVSPQSIEVFKAQRGYCLEDADAWLEAAVTTGSAGYAASLRAVHPKALVEDLIGRGDRLARAEAEALLQRLLVATGLPAHWVEQVLPAGVHQSSDLAFAAASWCLCVEYVHDLKRPPVAEMLAGVKALPSPVVAACSEVARHLRVHHAPFYKRTAEQAEALLDSEGAIAKAEELGKVDTFRFEEDKILEAALAGLSAEDWVKAKTWSSARVGPLAAEGSFWLRDDPTRQAAWELIHSAAALGEALVCAGARCTAQGSLEAAVDVYAERGAAVDQAHRHLEQRRIKQLHPQLPEFEKLRALLDQMRQLWRTWANQWARDFNGLCRAHGFLPDAARQQRTLFDDVVRPMTQEPGTTAFFVVDALRFEMGEELFRQFAEESATTAHLKGRLAELPSVTEVGMNVLAPVATSGRLRPAFSADGGDTILGFQAGEYRVTGPESRRRAMHDRVGGANCPWLTLKEVLERDSTSLKRAVAQARLVVVHSEEIDAAGEKGVGCNTFDDVLQQLRAAWQLLRNAGVSRFIFTADHGFLLLDATTSSTVNHGTKLTPKRRHVFSAHGADNPGEVRVALADLGYEGTTAHVMFPETTAVFNNGKNSATSFAHGGNSLQERVIPVLTVVHRTPAGRVTGRYTLSAAVREGVAGMHCIEAWVESADQHAFDFSGPKEVEVSLQVRDSAQVRVELCQVRGQATLTGNAVLATVGAHFELFFRLVGPAAERVQVELYHGSQRVELAPCKLDARFDVTVGRTPSALPAASSEATEASTASAREPDAARDDAWLEAAFEDEGVRQVFGHLARHGAVTDKEASVMLGGARNLRRFAMHFETHASKAPFSVRIDVMAGTKRYVREGGSA